MKNLLALVLIVFSAAIGASACTNTYYVSTSGSDSNNGTSESTPWLHLPAAPGFTGSYSHHAGDCFIAKGGDVFHRSGGHLPLNVTFGGTSSTTNGQPGLTNNDYYGVDFTWGTGTNIGNVDTVGTFVFAHKALVNGSASGQGNPFCTCWSGSSIIINSLVYTIASVQSHDQLTLTTSAGTQTNVVYSTSSLWKQPEFDNDGFVSNGTIPGRALITLENPGGAWVTIDNWNLHDIVISVDINGSGIVDDEVGGLSNNYPTTNETVENSWLHGFCPPDHSGNITGIDMAAVGGGNANVLNNVITDVECPGAGAGVSNINGIVVGNTIHELDQPIFSAGHVVSNNVIYNTGYPVAQYDSGAHSNLDEIFADGGNYYRFNNLAYNFNEGWNMGGDMGWDGGCANYYFFNNVLIMGNVGNNMPYMVSNKSTNTSNCGTAQLWNSTLEYDVASSLVRFVCGGGGGTTAVLDFRNLHYITTGTPVAFDCSNYVSLVQTNNPQQSNTAATAQGYVGANFYAPTAVTNATVGAGANLSAKCALADPVTGQLSIAALCSGFTNSVLPSLNTSSTRVTWDAGAFQFTGGLPGPPPVTLMTNLPGGTVGIPYSVQLASGGTPPFKSPSTFPQGLSFAATGVLSGTPQASGTFAVNATVTDSYSPPQSASGSLGITIALAPPPPPPPPPPGNAVLGLSAAGSATDSGDSGYINASRYCAPTGMDGSAVTFTANVKGAVSVSPSNKWQGFIFSDNAGKISWAPLAFTAQGTLTANAANTLPISAKITGGTCYWLGYSTNGANNAANNVTLNPSGGQTAWTRIAFGTMPTSATASSGTSTSPLSLAVTYTTAPPPPAPALTTTSSGATVTLVPTNIPSGTPYTGSVTADGVTAPISGTLP